MSNSELIVRGLIGIGVLAILSMPFLVPFLFPRFRKWIRMGIEGDNRRLDIEEIEKTITFAVQGVCTIMLCFITFTIFLFDTRYPWELMLYFFAVIIGAEGKDVIVWLRNRRKG